MSTQVWRITTRVLRGTWKPVAVALCVGILQVLGAFGVIPSPARLSDGLRIYFDQYGLWAIGVTAFVENVVGVNVYFPGSIVILAAMGMTHGDPVRAVQTFIVITAASQLAQFVNYLLGRFWVSSDAASVVSFVELMAAFWHPQTAAIASLRCGDAQWPFTKFAVREVSAALVWHSFWAATMYHIGGGSESLTWLIWLFYAYLLVWFLQGVVRVKTDRSDSVISGDVDGVIKKES